jgi:hypothetical protein
MIARPPITRDGSQQQARHELTKAIYHRQNLPWPVRAVKWIGHQLDHLLSKALVHAPNGNVGALSLLVLLVVGIALIVWRVGIPRRIATIGAVLPDSHTMTAADHRKRSADAAAGGDYPTAVLERMRAITRELEERNILEPRPGRTATEVATDAGPRLGSAATSVHDAAGTFNDVVYGGKTATPALLAVVVTADEQVQASSRTLVMVT